MFEFLSSESIKIVMSAQEEARKLQSSSVEPEHILLGIIKNGDSLASKILIEKGADYEHLYEKIQLNSTIKISSNRFEIQFSHALKQAIELANNEIDKTGNNLIEPEHLLIGLINLGEGLAITLLRDIGINVNRIRWNLLRIKNEVDNDESITPNIFKFTKNIIKKIELGEIENIIARNDILEEIIPYLNLYNKIFPIIIGKKGVGKSSLITGIAQYLLEGKIYPHIQNYRILEFDFDNLLAEFFTKESINEAFKSLLSEIRQSKDIILVIDNIDNIFKKEFENTGINQLLIKFLESEGVYCIAIAEKNNYFNEIRNSSLDKYFNPIELEESTEEETKMFLEKYKTKFVKHYGIDIDELAIETITDYAKKFDKDNFLPKSAFKLMDLVMSKKKFSLIISQSRIKDMERHLRVLRNKRDVFIQNKDMESFEEIKKEAQIYEEGIKILKNNISSNIRSTLTSGDVKLLLGKKFNGE